MIVNVVQAVIHSGSTHRAGKARHLMTSVKLINQTAPTGEPIIGVCESYLSRLRGLMFTRELAPSGGIIMDEKAPSRMNAAIHMLFMNYPIAVLWLDPDLVVVDKVLAKRWALAYVPKKPARYVVELHASRLADYAVGDQLALADAPDVN